MNSYKLRNVPSPDCQKKCKMFRIAGENECKRLCPHKFKYIQKYTEESVENTLKYWEGHYGNRIQEIADSIFQGEVIPFCKKHRLNFLSGMGTWCFAALNDKIINIERYPSKSFQRMTKLLTRNVELYGYEIGTMMNDYVEFLDR